MFLLPWFESHAISTIITPQGIAYLEKAHYHFGWCWRRSFSKLLTRPTWLMHAFNRSADDQVVHSNFPKNRRYFRLKSV